MGTSVLDFWDIIRYNRPITKRGNYDNTTENKKSKKCFCVGSGL